MKKKMVKFNEFLQDFISQLLVVHNLEKTFNQSVILKTTKKMASGLIAKPPIAFEYNLNLLFLTMVLTY